MEGTKTPVKRGFGWKRVGNVCRADTECMNILKETIREYQELKDYCRHFETKRKSLFMMGKIRAGATFLDNGKVKELMGLPLSADDKKALFVYFDASTRIMVLETGMGNLPEGQYREIAFDRYLGRMTYKEIMAKHGVNQKTVQRALRRTNEYLLVYARWYLDMAGKRNEAAGL